MATAITPLANITLGSAAANVTFSSITSTYRDLMVVLNVAIASGNDRTKVQVNTDTGSNYTFVSMAANGSTTYSHTGTENGMWVHYAGYNLSTGSPASALVHFFDYSTTDKHKSMLSRSDSAAGWTVAVANKWANTSAITSLKFFNDFGTNFPAGTTFALYGVSA